MGMLPQSNATLLSLSRGGFTEDYDRPAGNVAPAWQGQEDAYVQRQIVSSFDSAGELKRVMRVTLFLSGDFPVPLQSGDTLVYTAGDPDDAVTLAGRVQNSVDPAFLPDLDDYFKVALEEVNAP